MEQVFNDLVAWMTAVSPAWAYLIILVIAYGENVLPPVPGDLVIVFGGYLVGVGRLDLWLVVGLATVGGSLGFMTMYVFGRRVGTAVFDPHRLRWLPKEQILKARDWLKRWGYGVIAANRFLSGARSVIALTVGMARMDAWKTAAFATVSALVWTGLIAYAGFAVGENWPVVRQYLNRYGQVMVALLGLVIAGQVLRVYLRRRRRRSAGAGPGERP